MTNFQIRPGVRSERGEVIRLLQQASLPTQDLLDSPDVVQFWIAETGGRLVGAIGLERFADDALLRSLVVDPAFRNTGVGTALVDQLERAARASGVRQLVLLTRTAKPFFERRGYCVIERNSAPGAVKSSAEFSSLCPASATCMAKPLDGTDAARQDVAKPMRVLFLCTGNSCRSILGEATFNHLAPAGWRAMSAGSRPTGQVHPRSLALLAREGIATEGYHSKSWDDLPQAPDIVITVCASAAGEACPVYLGPVLRTHWGVADPAHATGTDAEIDAAFVAAYRTLRKRIEAFLALPLDDLKNDRTKLKAEMDRIGSQVR